MRCIKRSYIIAEDILSYVESLKGGAGGEYAGQVVTTAAAETVVPQYQHLQPATRAVLLQQTLGKVTQPLVLKVIVAATDIERGGGAQGQLSSETLFLLFWTHSF